jgi:hypothetical protein
MGQQPTIHLLWGFIALVLGLAVPPGAVVPALRLQNEPFGQLPF